MYIFNESRIQKNEELEQLGISTYPSNDGLWIDGLFIKTLQSLENVSSIDELQKFSVTGAGRLRFKNEIGNLGFGRLFYDNYKLQIMISKKEVSSQEYMLWKKLDLGDFVRFTGTCTRTKAGELTVRILSLTLVSKCMNFMPDKISGVSDPETLQRQRYVDLMVNSDSYDRFIIRSKAIKFIRNFLDNLDFIEVETPTLQAIPGGANARPFTTHHNALGTDLFMRIAPELYLKRLIVGGIPRVYEIGKNFRNEGISTTHNPEFTMVEFYASFWTYEDLMKMTKQLFGALLSHLNINSQVHFGDYIIDFDDWRQASFLDLIIDLGVSDPYSNDDMAKMLLRNGIDIDASASITKLWDLAFGELIEPKLINPTFVTDYPKEISPLAKSKANNPQLTDRFELFIAGFEVSNGFNELNDPIEQSARFADQLECRIGGDNEAMYYDHDYINALTYGLPPCAGQGIGIDRLVMLLTNSSSIRNVILFPAKR